MVMLYIKREGRYSINLKTDLVKYNGCYDSMIGYILKLLFQILEILNRRNVLSSVVFSKFSERYFGK